MRLVIDVNLTARWVTYLQSASHDVVYWTSVGRAYDPDTLIMSFAQDEQRIVLTSDLDFAELLRRSGASQPTVIQSRAEITSPEVMGAAVLDALRKIEENGPKGHLITITGKGIRSRVLPFGRSANP